MIKQQQPTSERSVSSSTTVSLRKLFSKNGIPLVKCCPSCLSERVQPRKKIQGWGCLDCEWKGQDLTLRVAFLHTNQNLVSRIASQALLQKNLIEKAIEEGIKLPIEITGVLQA